MQVEHMDEQEELLVAVLVEPIEGGVDRHVGAPSSGTCSWELGSARSPQQSFI